MLLVGAAVGFLAGVPLGHGVWLAVRWLCSESSARTTESEMKIYAENKLDAANGWPTRGIISYVPDGDRKIAQLSLVAGAHDQSILHESHSFRADGATFWAGAWWRFPQGYSWEGAPGYEGREHKLMLVSVEDGRGRGRLMVNAEGQDGHLRAYVEGFDGDPNRLLLDTTSPVPLDGLWHYVEVQMDRDAAGMGRARLWLDGKLVGDRIGTTGNSPFCMVQVGAYVNQGSDVAKSFNCRDFVCADVRLPGSVTPPVPPIKPPPVTEPELIARELEAMSKHALELADRVRKLHV